MLGNGLKGKRGRNEAEITFILLPLILEALGKAKGKVQKKNP